MNKVRWTTALYLLLAAVAAGSHEAHAACNSFPGAPPPGGGGGALNLSPAAKAVAAATQAARERASAPLLYLGALGRVDGLEFAPGATIFAAADTVCARPRQPVPPLAQRAFQAESLDGLVAVALIRRPGTDTVLARVYTPVPGRRHTAKKRLCGLFDAFKNTAIQPLDDCARPLMKKVETGPGKAALGIPLPTENELAAPTDAIGALADDASGSRVTLLAIDAQNSAAALAKIVAAVEQHGCEKSCESLVQSDVARAAVCVDQVFTIGWSQVAERVEYLRKGFPDCDNDGIGIPPQGPKNKFAKLCEHDGNGTGKCTAPAEKALRMREDSCGRLHIPFEWEGVFDNDPVVLGGQSATSRSGLAEANRIWVPGREFVGSTPIGSDDQTPDVDWRKPDITVWYPTTTEFGLKGVVDKPDASTVHVFPNYEVIVVCKDQSAAGVVEACEGVDRGVNSSIPNCACRDRYDADCECEKVEPARYFFCVGGPRDSMPCTRHQHCNDDGGDKSGLCTGVPVCRAPGSVYNVTHENPDTGATCNTDESCASDAAGLTQCGLRLFDLSAQKETGNADKHVRRLDRRLIKGGEKRRGTCVNDPNEDCNNVDASADPKGCDDGECRGYRLVVGP